MTNGLKSKYKSGEPSNSYHSKIFGIIKIKKMKCLYSENFETLKKYKKTPYIYGSKELEIWTPYQNNIWIQCNPIIPKSFFWHRKKIQKKFIETPMTKNTQCNPEQKEYCARYPNSWFQNVGQRLSNESSMSHGWKQMYGLVEYNQGPRYMPNH